MAPVAGSLSYTPPDGGWGWVVVLGAFISIGFSYSTAKAVTVFYKDIQEYFGASYSEIAWIASLVLACTYAGGPISSILVNKYGSRPVVIAGGLLAGTGMILATFCTSLVQLYICAGIIPGFGFSMNLQPSVIVVGQYFQKKRPIANGLAMAGSPVVLCTLAPLTQFLFHRFGWRGSFFILGAIVLNCCVAGSLFRPIGPLASKNKKQKDPEKVNKTLLPPEKVTEKEKEGCLTRFNRMLDLTLFKHRGFLIYLVGNVLMFLAFYPPLVFLAPYAKHMGVDEYSAAFLLSILAIVDMFARPLSGIVANTKWIRPNIQYFFSLSVVFNGACHLMCPLATNYMGLVVYVVFFGLAFGMVCATIFETLIDLVGLQRFPSAVGLVTIVECVPLLLGPPVGGAIVDYFGDYKYMFYECGVIMVCAGLFLVVGNFINYRLLRREAETEEKKKAVEMKEGVGVKKEDYSQVATEDKLKIASDHTDLNSLQGKSDEVNGCKQ